MALFNKLHCNTWHWWSSGKLVLYQTWVNKSLGLPKMNSTSVAVFGMGMQTSLVMYPWAEPRFPNCHQSSCRKGYQFVSKLTCSFWGWMPIIILTVISLTSKFYWNEYYMKFVTTDRVPCASHMLSYQDVGWAFNFDSDVTAMGNEGGAVYFNSSHINCHVVEDLS